MDNLPARAEQPAPEASGAAWATTIDDHRVALVRYVQRFLRSERDSLDIAEDIAQTAIIRVYNYQSRYDSGRAAVKTLLFTAARRLAINWTRDQRGHDAKLAEFEGSLDDGDDLVTQGIADAEKAEAYTVILGNLNERARAVLEMSARGETYARIAAELRFPTEGACRKFAHDVRKRVKRQFHVIRNS